MTNVLARGLTDDQKAAVLTALNWIGLWASMDIADTVTLLPKFAERYKLGLQLLGFDEGNPLFSKYQHEESEEILFATLKTMPPILKSWFVIETYMMLAANGDISRRSMNVTLMYCERIGISEEAYLKIIQQAYMDTGDYEPGLFP